LNAVTSPTCPAPITVIFFLIIKPPLIFDYYE
jgi:hypothetical protein